MNFKVPSINLAFFREFAKGDPEQAVNTWNEWLKNRRREVNSDAKCRKAMEICTGLGDASIRHYLKRRHQFLRKESLDLLDRISKGLNCEPPARGHLRRVSRRYFRIALLTQLNMPSESFHLELIRGIVREAQAKDIAISLHEVSSDH